MASDKILDCPTCKTELIEGQKFCQNCGKKIACEVRAHEEIEAMFIKILNGARATFDPLPRMLVISAIGVAFSWVKKDMDDEKFLKIFENPTKSLHGLV